MTVDQRDVAKRFQSLQQRMEKFHNYVTVESRVNRLRSQCGVAGILLKQQIRYWDEEFLLEELRFMKVALLHTETAKKGKYKERLMNLQEKQLLQRYSLQALKLINRSNKFKIEEKQTSKNELASQIHAKIHELIA